uniref:Protein ILRUN n=1 Tax=Phascolarctos cinereus TaxID=38626 RepID=A0A6P5LHA7_PHACI|nr:uncharacterized protein C6orf106 homolog isoform X6 [Phascolarctos cinereus]
MEGMDVDLDPELMQKFSCLGTTDKDVLISEFQRLLGFQLNPAGCAFFLDMTNWNLQAAIGAYYDFESPNISVPSMSFVEDVTIGEGESIPPDTQFTKTWRIQNSGAEAWPPGVCLKYVGGDQFGHVNMVMVRSLEPQEMADVSVQMCSPSIAGMYQGQWRMCTATGLYYGDVIWVILSVEVGGLLGVTQQLSSFETEFNTQPHRKIRKSRPTVVREDLIEKELKKDIRGELQKERNLDLHRPTDLQTRSSPLGFHPSGTRQVFGSSSYSHSSVLPCPMGREKATRELCHYPTWSPAHFTVGEPFCFWFWLLFFVFALFQTV